MATGTSILNVLMKQPLQKRVYKSFQDETVLWSILMDGTKKEKTNARGTNFTTYTRPNPSFGSLGEGAYLPVPGSPGLAMGNLTITRQYQEGELTGDVRDMDDVDTIGGLVKPVIKWDTDAFKRKLNVQCYSDGSGKLGIVTAANSGAGTFTCDPATTPTGSRNILIGARLQFYTTAGVQRTGGGVTVSIVTAKNDTTGVVTVDALPTNVAANDLPVYENSYGRAMMGLEGLITDANVTLQGINLASEPTMKATVYDAGGNPLTAQMINTAITRTKRRGGVQAPVNDFLLITNPIQSDAYRNLGYALTRIVEASGNKMLDLGFPNVTHNGLRWREDNDCGDSDMWGIRLSALLRLIVVDPQIMELINGQMFLPKPGTGTYADSFLYGLYAKLNLAVVMANALFRIKNLSVTGLG